MKTTFALIAALGLSFTGVAAQAGVPSLPGHIIAFGDVDGDGALTGAELRRAERRQLAYETRN